MKRPMGFFGGGESLNMNPSFFERLESGRPKIRRTRPKLIPERDEGPTCKKKICHAREIKVKVYIEDRLWEAFGRRVGKKNIKGKLQKQVNAMVGEANKKHLIRLNNGGYKIVTDGAVTKLSESDVKLGTTFIDRTDNYQRKHFNRRTENEMLPWALVFQQAVQKMPTSKKLTYNSRVLFYFDELNKKEAIAEEYCICEQNKDYNHGCIAVIGINNYILTDWSGMFSLLAHEFGHMLGMEPHDDDYYTNSHKLIMWTHTHPEADIWSPEARKRIGNTNHSCLDKNKNRTKKILKPQKKTRKPRWILVNGRWRWNKN